MRQLNFTHQAYPYLIAQRGALDDMRADTHAWSEKYTDALNLEFDRLRPFLPADCDSILDVGAGMGGIDVLLSEYYEYECDITLLDGIDDPPDMRRHRHTFSHFGVAKDFLAMNGVWPKRIHCLDAKALPGIAPRFFDLIVSFKSWCFHYPPRVYLDFIASGCIAERTLLMVDVRKVRSYHWLRELQSVFRLVNLIHYQKKCEMHLLVAR